MSTTDLLQLIDARKNHAAISIPGKNFSFIKILFKIYLSKIYSFFMIEKIREKATHSLKNLFQEFINEKNYASISKANLFADTNKPLPRIANHFSALLTADSHMIIAMVAPWRGGPDICRMVL